MKQGERCWKSSIRAFVLSIVCAVVNNCDEARLKIQNNTDEDLYVALATTENFKHDELFRGGTALVRQLGEGLLRPLKKRSWVAMESLPRADKKLGMTRYDRTLWVSADIGPLSDAIYNFKIADKDAVHYGEIGSKPIVTIVKQDGKYKIATSNNTTERFPSRLLTPNRYSETLLLSFTKEEMANKQKLQEV